MDREILSRLTIDDLSGDQRELADIIGIEAYKKLAAYAGGGCIYIGVEDTKTRLRNAEIREKFNGYNHRALAAEYGMTERHLRRIVEGKRVLIPGQISLFDLGNE